MSSFFRCMIVLLAGTVMNATTALAQSAPAADLSNYQQVNSYVNPVLPGDHPDPTLLKVGDDFYHCGSSFHFNAYLPVYHSKDLVHWEVISRIVYPSGAGMVSDKPS